MNRMTEVALAKLVRELPCSTFDVYRGVFQPDQPFRYVNSERVMLVRQVVAEFAIHPMQGGCVQVWLLDQPLPDNGAEVDALRIISTSDEVEADFVPYLNRVLEQYVKPFRLAA